MQKTFNLFLTILGEKCANKGAFRVFFTETKGKYNFWAGNTVPIQLAHAHNKHARLDSKLAHFKLPATFQK